MALKESVRERLAELKENVPWLMLYKTTEVVLILLTLIFFFFNITACFVCYFIYFVAYIGPLLLEDNDVKDADPKLSKLEKTIALIMSLIILIVLFACVVSKEFTSRVRFIAGMGLFVWFLKIWLPKVNWNMVFLMHFFWDSFRDSHRK